MIPPALMEFIDGGLVHSPLDWSP